MTAPATLRVGERMARVIIRVWSRVSYELMPDTWKASSSFAAMDALEELKDVPPEVVAAGQTVLDDTGDAEMVWRAMLEAVTATIPPPRIFGKPWVSALTGGPPGRDVGRRLPPSQRERRP